MAHIKTQIRNAFVAVLTDAATIAGSAVEAGRIGKVHKDSNYFILVSTPSEEIQPRPNGKPRQRSTRFIEVVVELIGRVDRGESAVDVADIGQTQIEQALEVDPSLGGLCLDSYPTQAITSLGAGKGDEFKMTIIYRAQATRTQSLDSF